MNAIDAAIKELRSRRDRLEDLISGLEKINQEAPQPKHAAAAVEETPAPRRRGRKPRKGKKANGTMDPALTCMECNPPRTFETALGKSQHVTWKHTGRKKRGEGAEKSLTGSTLMN